MKRETFIMAIESIEKQYMHDIELAKRLTHYYPHCSIEQLAYDNHLIHNALIQVLQEEMKDERLNEFGQSWIEWFCWETNFGRESFRLKAYRKDGSVIKMYTAGDLYDYLMEAK